MQNEYTSGPVKVKAEDRWGKWNTWSDEFVPVMSADWKKAEQPFGGNHSQSIGAGGTIEC